MPRLVGEAFENYLVNQIDVRQNLAGSGYNTKLRSNTEISLLNNKNAWLKLASSVRVTSTSEVKEALKKLKLTDVEIEKYLEKNQSGEKRLQKIGLDNPSQFLGNKLASKSVLFNSLSEVTPSGFDKEKKEKIQGSYNLRAGVDPSNTLWNSNYAYGLGGSKFGITPPPGLVDAKIRCMNRGSIREADVTIKAYNQFQFELIETLYLRLGFSMLLEWGWDKFLNDKQELQSTGNTLTEDIWFKDYKTYNFKKLLRSIERYREIYQGNYDGFLGKVTNFDWKFSPDGTYDISLKLLTVGDVIESLKVNLPSSIKTQEDVQKQLEDYASPNSFDNIGVNSSPANLLDTSLVNNAGSSTLAYDLFTDTLGDTDKWVKKQSPYFNLYFNLNEEGKGSDILSEQMVKDGEGVNIDKFGYFLTFGELIKKINKFCIPSLSGVKIIGMDNNVDTTICSSFPNQISLDPKVCLVKPNFIESIALNNYGQFSANSQGVKAYWKFIDKMKQFQVVEKNGSIYYGKTLNIYLNYNFVSECLEAQTTDNNIFLFKFLQKICDGINSAMGGIMKLEPIIQDDLSIVIQDQNQIRGIEESSFADRFNEETNFELFGYHTKNLSGSFNTTSNFVRDFGFKTNITPDLASMISIGAAANSTSTKNYDATAFANWNQGLLDQYSFDYTDPIEEDTDKNITKTDAIDYDPFTVEEIGKLKEHYENSTLDKRTWIGTKRASNSKTFTKFGISFKGKRDVANSPISGEDYENVTWVDYIEEVADDRNKGVEVSPQEKQKFSANYIYYLIQGFRGKVQGNAIYDSYYFHLNDEFIQMGKQAFKAYVDAINNELYNSTGNPSTSIGFIPVDLGLKCDGISGVKIYNALKIRQEFLPPQYPNALEFVITKVDHSISSNDWETDLGTISTPKTKAEDISAFATGSINKIATANLEFQAYDGNANTVSLTSGYNVTNTKTKSGLIYYPENSTKKAIMIHHTAGWRPPKSTIESTWRKKTFPIGTQYVIGRDGPSEHVFPDEYWSNHTGVSRKLSKAYLAIELQNIGYLVKLANGKYKAWPGQVKTEAEYGGVSKPYTINSNNEIIELQSYRSYKYCQEYTDFQMEALRTVLVGWNAKFNIPLNVNFSNIDDVFPEFGKKSSNAMKPIPGVYTHNSVRPTGKFDVFPTKKMIEFLKSLSS